MRPKTPRPPQRTARRRLLADRVARWVVTAGGLAVIASILGILAFILHEVWPLVQPSEVEVAGRVPVEAEAAVVDEHRTHLAGVDRAGTVVVHRLDTGALVERRAFAAGTAPAPEGDREAAGAPTAAGASMAAGASIAAGAPTPFERVQAVASRSGGVLAGATADGRVVAAPVDFRVRYEGDRRVVAPAIGEPASFELDPEGAPLGVFAVRLERGGGGVAAAATAAGELAIVERTLAEEAAGDTVAATVRRATARLPYRLSALALGDAGRRIYAGTPDGQLLWWRLGSDLDPAAPGALQAVSAGRSAITSLELLVGETSLVVGQADGSLSVWFPVRQPDGAHRLTRVRDLPPREAAVTALAPSRRSKGFVAADAAGTAGLYHSTSDQVLWQGRVADGPVADVAYAPKGDAAYALGPASATVLAIDAPHPEITWDTLFGEIWYEGYEEPELVWQSSGATDEVEPKLSLVPLLVGTLKGTFYSLLIALPLAVLGAMYLSQFMHPGYKRRLKPVIEIMAALPSVVLGFLAGLWLAPRIERAMPALFAMVVVLPLAVLAAGALWRLLPRTLRNRLPAGTELFAFAVALAAAAATCFAWAPELEAVFFGGSFQRWLETTTGLGYDQRNAVVVGIAMGFAVIPIIFAIAEDAFSNVPPNLVAGSLALGATRWQTVTRVVLPTASPGIFSAVMVGLGRAVGETMIVLMATGNTPIMSWNPFNGFRTLSANIAVEIPEAPHGGSLYRTLFLAALLLFVLTFVVNTLAEVVRQRLRRRYAQL